MKSLKKTAVSAAIALAVTVTASPNVEASLKDRFQSATVSSGGGTYDVMGRTVHQGGYARTRFPSMGPLRPVTFEGPSVKGGCNGFDLFGGSFSYIGKEELVEYLKAVATNTASLATYMFLTYLQNTCSSCKEVMDGLYALQDAINQTFGGSCETAKGLVGGMQSVIDGESNDDWDLMTQRYEAATKKYSKAADHFSDAAEMLKESQEDREDAAKKAIPDDELRMRATSGGNMLYWAIMDGDLVDIYDDMLKTGLTEQELHAFLTYLVGNSVETHKSGSEGKGAAEREPIIRTGSIEHFVHSDFPDGPVTGGRYGGDFGTTLSDTTQTLNEMFPELKKTFDDFDCAITAKKTDQTACSSDWVGIVNILRKSKEDLPPGFNYETSKEKEYLERLNTGSMFTGALYELGGSTGLMESLYDCYGTQIKVEFVEHQILQMVMTLRKQLDFVKDVQPSVLNAFKTRVDEAYSFYAASAKGLKDSVDKQSCSLPEKVKSLIDLKRMSKGK